MSGAVTLGAAAAIGFLLGSIPFGLLVLRAAGGPDPRTVGSGNIGATNVVRAGGRTLGALTLLLDAGKGLVACLIFGPTIASAVAGGAAVLGHCFTPWLKLKGGKGVATFAGISVIGGIFMPLVFLLAWLTGWVGTRISAIAGVTACAVTALASVLAATLAPEPHRIAGAGVLVLGSLVVAVRHRKNFEKLIAERRLGRAGVSKP